MARRAMRTGRAAAVVAACGLLAGCGLGDLDLGGWDYGGSYYKGTLDLVNAAEEHLVVEVMGDAGAALAPGAGLAREVDAGEVPVIVVWDDGVVTEQVVRVAAGEAVAVPLGR